MEAHETVTRDGLTAKLYQDKDPFSPAELDNLGTLRVVNSRYGFAESIDTSALDLPVIIRAARIVGCTVLPARLNDFGSNGLTIHETEHDDANGFLITDEARADELGAPYDSLERQLRGELKEWDQYLRGEVYGYTIADETGEVVESLWGLYGWDYARETMQAALTSETADLERRAVRLAKHADQIEAEAAENVKAAHKRAEELRARIMTISGPIPF